MVFNAFISSVHSCVAGSVPVDCLQITNSEALFTPVHDFQIQSVAVHSNTTGMLTQQKSPILMSSD